MLSAEDLTYDDDGGGEPPADEEEDDEADAEAAAAWSAWRARIWFCLAASAMRLRGAGMGCAGRIEVEEPSELKPRGWTGTAELISAWSSRL